MTARILSHAIAWTGAVLVWFGLFVAQTYGALFVVAGVAVMVCADGIARFFAAHARRATSAQAWFHRKRPAR